MRKTDYMIHLDGQDLFLNIEQQNTRREVIEEYKQCRKEIGISQLDLGERAGISQPNITRFESGNYNPSLDMLVRVAAAMGKKIKINLV